MPNSATISKKINEFNKIINVSGIKVSIRWVLFSSILNVSTAKNLLLSEDVLAALGAIKKLGIKSKVNKNICKIYGKGSMDINIKNISINAKNSGTLGRLILGFLVNTSHPIKIYGDKSLSKRDFKRVSDPP